MDHHFRGNLRVVDYDFRGLLPVIDHHFPYIFESWTMIFKDFFQLWTIISVDIFEFGPLFSRTPSSYGPSFSRTSSSYRPSYSRTSSNYGPSFSRTSPTTFWEHLRAVIGPSYLLQIINGMHETYSWWLYPSNMLAATFTYVRNPWSSLSWLFSTLISGCDAFRSYSHKIFLIMHLRQKWGEHLPLTRH